MWTSHVLEPSGEIWSRTTTNLGHLELEFISASFYAFPLPSAKLHFRITKKQHLHLNTILANSRQITYGCLTKCFVFELVNSELCCLLGSYCLHGSDIDRIKDGTSAISWHFSVRIISPFRKHFRNLGLIFMLPLLGIWLVFCRWESEVLDALQCVGQLWKMKTSLIICHLQISFKAAGAHPFWHQGSISWKTDFLWNRVRDKGMVSGWFKRITFIVNFISIIITTAPPQIIRH